MKTKKQDKNQVIAGSTGLASVSYKKRKLKIYGSLTVALVFGLLGAYTLLFSKAADVPPHDLSNLTELTTGQTMSAGQSLVSSGSDNHNTSPYRLVMQTDGNLVVYTPGRQAIWQSGTPGTGSNNRLVLQSDGNLVVYTEAGRAVWNTGTVRGVHGERDKLLMQADGNVVLYSSNGPVWSSYTGVIRPSSGNIPH